MLSAHLQCVGRSFLKYRLGSRSFTNLALGQHPSGFSFWPKYFNNEEQRTLLAASLHKLDHLESRQTRRKRKNYWESNPVKSNDLLEMFAPDELYEFEEGHYDGVIHHFREMHLSSWPVEEFEGLQPILEKLYSLCPSTFVQTHLLHLASHGYILPHIDNVDSSGSWILGVSLGADRILRMQKVNNPKEEGQRVTLPSGSVYIQRDDIRYNYLHSIERERVGQRLSVMIRNLKSNSLSG